MDKYNPNSLGILVSILLLITITLELTEAEKGPTEKGPRERGPTEPSGYIECHPGDLNVIIAAPHGGMEKPDDIAKRHHGCYVNNECVWTQDCGQEDSANCRAVTINDAFTLQLAEVIAENLFNLTGKRPATILNHLHRSKMDANRDIDQAAFGNPKAEQAWHEFQNCIIEAKRVIEGNERYSGMGLFIDVHGHGHPNDWAELGYLISGSALDDPNTVIQPDTTSIHHLSTNVQGSFDILLRGTKSFGYFLQNEGYSAVPSPENPGPDGEKYFRGGYNTGMHGSRDGGKIDAIQIESARVNREFSAQPAYGRAIATAIVNFMGHNYPAEKLMRSDFGEATTTEGVNVGVGLNARVGFVVIVSTMLTFICNF